MYVTGPVRFARGARRSILVGVDERMASGNDRHSNYFFGYEVRARWERNDFRRSAAEGTRGYALLRGEQQWDKKNADANKLLLYRLFSGRTMLRDDDKKIYTYEYGDDDGCGGLDGNQQSNERVASLAIPFKPSAFRASRAFLFRFFFNRHDFSFHYVVYLVQHARLRIIILLRQTYYYYNHPPNRHPFRNKNDKLFLFYNAFHICVGNR